MSLRLYNTLSRSIETFEPRLAAVRVRAGPTPDDELCLTLEIAGDLVVDTVREPITFVVLFDPQTKKATIHAGA